MKKWTWGAYYVLLHLPDQFTTTEFINMADKLLKAKFQGNLQYASRNAKLRQKLQVLVGSGDLKRRSRGHYEFKPLRTFSVYINAFEDAPGIIMHFTRELTEAWVAQNLPCPRCGSRIILEPPGTELVDGKCKRLKHEFQIKGSSGLRKSIVKGGSHLAVERRLNTRKALPDLILVSYDVRRLMILEVEHVKGSKLLKKSVVRYAKRLKSRPWRGVEFHLGVLRPTLLVGSKYVGKTPVQT
jgi:DNA-directed RNA polymerase subunit RPC12/RpoP